MAFTHIPYHYLLFFFFSMQFNV